MSFDLFGTPLYDPRLQSRAITMENPRGGRGAGGKALGGRKGAPCLQNLEQGQTFTFAEIEGPGAIRHIWLTTPRRDPRSLRNLILRFYWDGQETPSVEAPWGDFFGVCHGAALPHESLFLVTPEGRGFNSFFLMPFRRGARLTITNETGEDAGMFFYQVDYTLGDPVGEDTPLFHAQFRRVPRTTMVQDYGILDGVIGRGRYLGASLGLVDHVPGKSVWWGEGEIKIYLDGDTEWPTICGTGSEDYCGSGWGLGEFTAREMGAPLSGEKYVSFYRFHARDPIYFSRDLRVTWQQIGNDGTYEPADPAGPLAEFIRTGRYKKDHWGGNFERVDDVCSTAYWYQTLPTQPFPEFPSREIRCLDLPEPPPASSEAPGAAAGPQGGPTA